jgi:hypothetical protein
MMKHLHVGRAAIFLCLLITGVHAATASLAVVPVNTVQRALCAGVTVLKDLGSTLVVPLDAANTKFLQERGLAFQALAVEPTAGACFVVFKAGLGRYSLPGPALWQDDRHALVELTPVAAAGARASGFRLMPVSGHAYPLPAVEPVTQLSLPFDSLISTLVAQVSADSLRSEMYRLQNFGTRYTYSRKCDTCAWRLSDRFSDLGWTVESDTYLCGTQRDMSYNVVATKAGTVHPESIVIACGHFDSYSDPRPDLVAPGADDNASGTAALVEIARVLAPLESRWTIKLIAFSGEEQWMVGSYHWVESVAVRQNLKIAGAYNLDMFAYTPYESTMLYVNTNLQSRPLAVRAESANSRYGIGLDVINFLDPDCAGDNLPFWENNFPAVFALEDSEYGIWNGSNPNYHTPGDSMGYIRIGQVRRTTQLSLACIASLAGVYRPSGIASLPAPAALPAINITPNPFAVRAIARGREQEVFILFDAAGRNCGRFPGSSLAAGLAPGVYFLTRPGAQPIVKLR